MKGFQMSETALTPQSPDFTICHECDVLMRLPNRSVSSTFRCPRCLSPVKGHDSEGLAKPLTAVAAGLIFFWPANFMPILQMTILGIESNHTMIGAVRVMFDSGMVPVSLMVLFCSVVAPLFEFLLLGLVLVQVAVDRNIVSLPLLFRLYTYLDSWAMLEVYVISLLVSVIKLIGMATVTPGIGMLCLVGMMLSSIAVKVTLHQNDVWRKIETICNG
jgi:paraquat-inducible protein A